MYEGVKMLPRRKLIQCFSCKNNLECWGLHEEIQLGAKDREMIIDHDEFIQKINEFLREEGLSIGEYFGMISALFISNLRCDGEVKRRDVYQLLSVLYGTCNVNDDSWVCLVDDTMDEGNYSYEERK